MFDRLFITKPAAFRSVARSCAVMAAVLAVILGLSTPATCADARFDLAGPRVEVRVTRAGITLPIASVPNLQPGDRLWLHPDLPASQSIHYLMVLVFLRGTTNPPPTPGSPASPPGTKRCAKRASKCLSPPKPNRPSSSSRQ